MTKILSSRNLIGVLFCSLFSDGVSSLRTIRKNAQRVLSSFCSIPQHMAIAHIFCLMANITFFKTQVIVGEVRANRPYSTEILLCSDQFCAKVTVQNAPAE